MDSCGPPTRSNWWSANASWPICPSSRGNPTPTSSGSAAAGCASRAATPDGVMPATLPGAPRRSSRPARPLPAGSRPAPHGRATSRGCSRCGWAPCWKQVVRLLPQAPDVLLVDGTGRDHPRRAGLALHLGAELDIPTVGVTHRPLVARGDWPGDMTGARRSTEDRGGLSWPPGSAPAQGSRPLVVHPGWRTDLDTAVEVVRRTAVRRTPEPLRVARQAAREARAAAGGERLAPAGRPLP